MPRKANGGKGVLIGGATGVAPANVVILGEGLPAPTYQNGLWLRWVCYYL